MLGNLVKSPFVAIVTITFRYERALGPRVREPDRGKEAGMTKSKESNVK